MQVTPVSVATVLLQEPFMLFYQAQEGIQYGCHLVFYVDVT